MALRCRTRNVAFFQLSSVGCRLSRDKRGFTMRTKKRDATRLDATGTLLDEDNFPPRQCHIRLFLTLLLFLNAAFDLESTRYRFTFEFIESTPSLANNESSMGCLKYFIYRYLFRKGFMKYKIKLKFF